MAIPYDKGAMNALFRRAACFPLVCLACLALAAVPADAEKGRKKPIPVVKPEEKAAPAAPAPSAAAEPNALFEEIEFGNTLVIEGKVEKPQVQFTLLKEPPPEKEIRFETSFLQNILKQERENTFDAARRYGKD
jgi:hypothetical protein